LAHTQPCRGFCLLTLDHAYRNPCPLHSGTWIQTNTANKMWFWDYHKLHAGTYALSDLHYTFQLLELPTLGVTRYILSKDHYKISKTFFLINECMWHIIHNHQIKL